MTRFVHLGVVLVLVAVGAFLEDRAVGQTPAATSSAPHNALVNTYCVGCHNSRVKAGGLGLDNLNLDLAFNDAPVWEKAIRKLRGNLMPPPGSPQPQQKDIDAFIAWTENTLDANAKGPKAGFVPIQRLNRTEYAASVKALVGVDVSANDVLPQDIQVEGFDNVASALSVSPAFLDQYITAARQVAKLAVGNPNPRVANARYSSIANQNPEVPLPLGTRGGIRFQHNFPADGEYRFNFIDLGVAQALYTGPVESEATLVMMIDGKIVLRKPVGGPEDLALAVRKGADGRAEILSRFQKIPIQVEAGVHDVVVAFIERAAVESAENVAASGARGGRMPGFARNDGVEIVGPFNPTGVSKTASRALIFVCEPKAAAEQVSCARQITENLARRAFRRPVAKDEVDRLMPFYDMGRRNNGTFDQGIEQVVAAVLASPEFLYRSIRGQKSVAPGSEPVLSDLELASRLSFFLWNTGPDDELLTLAADNGLSKPGVTEKQARRMLDDPRAYSLVTSFAMKWLNLSSLDSVVPDPAVFPGFNDQMRKDFAKEAELFISSILLEDRPVVELLTANHTFLNERLARHYGIQGVNGNQFRRVALNTPERFGLLGKAAVLMRTSYGDRTSPVLRGAWVLDKLLGTPPAPPPPNVETDLSQKAGEQPKTVRARLELHRDKPSCKQCHGVIDPTGLALENFDSIGTWRTFDPEAETNIDASTVLPNGTPINGVTELRGVLSQNPAAFAQALTEKLMMYAINRPLEYFDMPQVRGIVRGAAKDNYTLGSLVSGIVNSDAFRRQGLPAKSQKSQPAAVAAK